MRNRTDSHPQCYIIAGPNGAGKTTFAREFLPRYVKCVEFVNGDLIAQGLSPFAPGMAAAEAGRIALDRIHALASDGKDFAFETTLAARSYAPFLRTLKASGYTVHLFYLWIPDVQLALCRIADRVRQGGHNVPEADVRRRFTRSLQNLFRLYRDHTDYLYFFDNSGENPSLIFTVKKGVLHICQKDGYRRIVSEIP
ncbi:MAG: zeta toxin family protein [Planctomycetota bacterium]